MRKQTWIIVCAVLVNGICGAVRAEDWPSFRGPFGSGVSSEKNVPVTWDTDENIKWKVRLPGPGNGSPIVTSGRVLVACSGDGGRKRGLYCFDRNSGEQRWARTVSFDKVMPTHKTSPYCGSTPATDGDRVVVWHGSAGLHCYDLDGRRRWSRDLGEFRHIWGYGSSPVLYRDRVILNCGPGKRVFMTAVDLKTGKTIWETDEPVEGDGDRNEAGNYMGSWSTPVVTAVGGSDVVICSMATRVTAYDPQSGDIVWSCDGLRGRKGDLAYTSPVLADDVCVVMGGFKGPAIGLSLGGAGNITESHRLWRVELNPQRIGSAVYVGGYIYMANAGPNSFQCIAPKTGNVLWEERSDGAAHWGSLVYADGHLYATDQDGTTRVFRPDPEKFDEVAQNALGEPSNSTPAISDGEIFIRTLEHLFCIAR